MESLESKCGHKDLLQIPQRGGLRAGIRLRFQQLLGMPDEEYSWRPQGPEGLPLLLRREQRHHAETRRHRERRHLLLEREPGLGCERNALSLRVLEGAVQRQLFSQGRAVLVYRCICRYISLVRAYC